MSDQTWTVAGTYEVGPGVYRIPLPLPNDGLRAVNVYAIKDGDGLVLIDSGWALAESQQQLERSLAEIDHSLADIREFLVTHHHRDHYSQAVAIRQVFGTRISIGEGERSTMQRLAESDHDALAEYFESLTRAGAGEIERKFKEQASHGGHRREEWGLPDGWLQPGELVLTDRSLRIVPTPGHTRGHVVFYDDAAGALFAGDHVLPQITPSIGFEPGQISMPLADFMNSLNLVLSMPDALLLPAHGPVAPSVHARVEQLLEHHEERLTAAAKAVEQGADTAYDVAHILHWTSRQRAFADFDIFNQMLATNETLAHLDVLVARGWLTVTVSEDRIAHFSRA